MGANIWDLLTGPFLCNIVIFTFGYEERNEAARVFQQQSQRTLGLFSRSVKMSKFSASEPWNLGVEVCLVAWFLMTAAYASVPNVNIL